MSGAPRNASPIGHKNGIVTNNAPSAMPRDPSGLSMSPKLTLSPRRDLLRIAINDSANRREVALGGFSVRPDIVEERTLTALEK